MPNYSLKIEGLDELAANARKAGGAMQQLLYEAMVYSTTLIQEDAKRVEVGRFKNRTGNLRRSIFRRVESATRGIIGVGEKYGAYVEFGTRPHIIRARRARVLADKKANIIFGKVVRHPGSKPYPFMKPALENSTNLILNKYKDVAGKIVTVMAQ